MKDSIETTNLISPNNSESNNLPTEAKIVETNPLSNTQQNFTQTNISSNSASIVNQDSNAPHIPINENVPNNTNNLNPSQPLISSDNPLGKVNSYFLYSEDEITFKEGYLVDYNEWNEEEKKEMTNLIKDILRDFKYTYKQKKIKFPYYTPGALRAKIIEFVNQLGLGYYQNVKTKKIIQIVAYKKFFDPTQFMTDNILDLPPKSNNSFMHILPKIELKKDSFLSITWKSIDKATQFEKFIVNIFSPETNENFRKTTNISSAEIEVQFIPDTIYNLFIIGVAKGDKKYSKMFKFMSFSNYISGQLYVWGHNLFGSLGVRGEDIKNELSSTEYDSEKDIVKRPYINKALNSNIIDVKSNVTTLVLTDEGQIIQFGPTLIREEEAKSFQNDQYQFTDEDNVAPINSMPFLVEFPKFKEIEPLFLFTKIIIRQISCGFTFSMAISLEGLAFGWGSNEFGNLGIGKSNISSATKPSLLKLKDVQIKEIACGKHHCIALSYENKLYKWGKFQDDLLFIDKFIPATSPEGIYALKANPNRLYEPTLIKDTNYSGVPFLISAGKDISLFCTKKEIINSLKEKEEIDMVWTFGKGKYGQLGHGQELLGYLAIPKEIKDIPLVSESVEKVCIGKHYACILSKNKKFQNHTFLYLLGFSPTENISSFYSRDFRPLKLCLPENQRFDDLVGGDSHLILLNSEKNKMYTCGDARNGAVGISSKLKGNFSNPEPCGVWLKPVKIGAGISSSFAISTDEVTDN